MVESQSQSRTNNLIAYIEKHLKRFATNLEKVVEAGDVEAIHDLRVASRRLAEPLRILSPWVGRRRVDRINRCLRRARRAFRKARDLDVVQSSLCNAPPPAPLDATDMAQLEGVLTRRRERTLRKATRKARKSGGEDAIQAARELLDRFHQSAKCNDGMEAAVHAAATNLVLRWTDRLAQRDPRSPETTHLHDTRLCVKRLRYSAELRRDLEGREDDPLIRALSNLQELLGQWNDHLIASTRITAIASKDAILAQQPGWSAKLLHYAAARAQEAELLRQRIVEKWSTLGEAIHANSASHSTSSAVSGPTLAEASA